jgi:hypothetical protein
MQQVRICPMRFEIRYVLDEVTAWMTIHTYLVKKKSDWKKGYTRDWIRKDILEIGFERN